MPLTGNAGFGCMYTYLGFHGKLDDLEYVPVLEVVEPAWCSEFMSSLFEISCMALTVAVDWLHIHELLEDS